MRWPNLCTAPTDSYFGHAQTDPTRFVSGSDDGTVRLWSMRDSAATATIDSKANVCSVQLSPTNSHLLAFGSANYRVYLYDLRKVRTRSFAQLRKQHRLVYGRAPNQCCTSSIYAWLLQNFLLERL